MPTRKASWAIAIWTVAMGVALLAAASGIGQDCGGLAGGELSSCQASAWGRGIIGLGLLGFLLHSALDFTMRIPANAMLAALLAGAFLRPLRESGAAPPSIREAAA